MPVTPHIRTEILGLLGRIAPVQDRPMFGAVGLYCEGLFFGIIDDDALYFKVDDSNRADYEKAGMRQFCPTGTAMQYWGVPPAVLADGRKLKRWMDKAVAVARAVSAKKSARKQHGR